MLKWIFTTSLIVILFASISAQTRLGCMQKATVKYLDTIYLDSLPILTSSLYIIDSQSLDTLSNQQYKLQSDFLIWMSKPSHISIYYKKIPKFLTENTFLLDTNLISKTNNFNNLIEYEIPTQSTQNSSSNDLNYQGSFSRGVTFGNNQDLVLNSGLNLQLDGWIGNEIKIKAAISDQNIPLQPEGNTQQLKEFDKIFIEVSKDKNQLIAGDYDLQTQSHFLKYTKNLQGASFQNQYNLSNGKLTNRGSIAISKGNFQRQNLIVSEGNQGPYKLVGNQQESFIIILADTEKVFLDGNLLTRGESKDYIIDYNQGEIFFTPNIPINANSRIVVEFEYATQNYLKSLYAIDNHFENKKWNIDFHLFSEQESKNTNGLIDLSPTEKQLLAEAGDQVGNQYFSGIQSKIDPLNPIFYIQKDTIVHGISYKDILVFNPLENKDNRNVKFTKIGQGKGHYIRTNASTNGTVFQWIAPNDDGTLQGEYEPVVLLQAPTKHQIYDIGAAYKLSKNSHLSTEISMSNFDKNRFSKKDKNDNVGIAFVSKYTVHKSVGKSKLWQINAQCSYEFSDKKYKAYSPFRNPEFNRNWNISLLDTVRTTHFLKTHIQFSRDSIANFTYEFNSFTQKDFFQGFQQNGQIYFSKKGWTINGQGQLMNSQSIKESTQYTKPNLLISKRFSKLNNWITGIYIEQEKNKRYKSDSLSLESFYFNQSKWFIESQKSEHLFLGSHFLVRNDFTPLKSGFEQNIQSKEYKIFGHWKPKTYFRIEGSWLQRNVSIAHQKWTEQIPKKYQIGQINVNYSPLKGAIQMFSNYEIGGGQEAKLAYNYLEVKSGQGVYQWLDYNKDGIQQINEFEIAPYPDLANFIRIILPTQSYIATNFLKFNQSLAIIPKAKWHDSKYKIMKWVNYFSTQSTYFVHRKSNNLNNDIDWNPLISRNNDSLIIADNQSIRNSIFFNRAGQRFNSEFGFSNNQQKNILITGYESQSLAENFLKIHGKIKENYDVYLYLSKGEKTQNSENYAQKNYQLNIRKAQFKLIANPNKKWRNTLETTYLTKNNIDSHTPNKIIQKSIKLQIQYNQTDATSIETSLDFTKINYTGPVNTPVSYELLNGLQDGNNFIWQIQIHRKISKFAYINVGYTGRKTGLNRIVHLGNLQMTAQF